jgi:hypothetical protein
VNAPAVKREAEEDWADDVFAAQTRVGYSLIRRME